MGTPESTKVFIYECSPSAIAGLPHNLEYKIPGDFQEISGDFTSFSRRNQNKI